MSDFLNPLHPTNPSQQIQQDSTKVSSVAKNQNEYYENSDGIYLPSKGLFYLGDNKGKEYLKIRPLDYTDEDILMTESYYTNLTIFDELVDNVIVDSNGFKSKDLVDIDRTTIILWLRSTAFGNDFTIEYKCSNCGGGNGHSKHQNLKKGPGEITWKLNELSIPEYKPEILKELETEGSLTIITPLTQAKVKISIPTIGQQNAISKSYAKKKEDLKTSKNFFGTTTLLSFVQGVEISDDKWDYSKQGIDAFFRKIKLPLSDSRYILKRANDDLVLKYDTGKTFVCPDCDHTEEGVEMPIMHKNFLWLQP